MLTDLFIIGIFKLLFVEQFVRRVFANFAWLRICLFFKKEYDKAHLLRKLYEDLAYSF